MCMTLPAPLHLIKSIFMKPVLVFPFQDPDGTMFPHLQDILPDLKSNFGQAYITITHSTADYQAGNVAQLRADDFFKIYPIASELPAGKHFSYLYSQAAEVAQSDEIMHLCYIDRLSFALETNYRDQFLADVNAVTPSDLPLIFHRSPQAWASHPKNYCELESFVTRIGESLFDQTLDYGWCHLVVHAGQLREVMSKVTHSGLSMVAEMILHLQPRIKTRDVDWLSWEDPFISGRDAAELKLERENSAEEIRKRLSYVLPMVEALTKFSANEKNNQHLE